MAASPFLGAPILLLGFAGLGGIRGAALDVPFFTQQKNGCGAASVAMVMHYWGGAATSGLSPMPGPRDVYARLYQPSRKGILLSGMKGFLEQYGFRAFALRGEWPDITGHLAKGRPVIVALRKRESAQTHFVVVTEASPASVRINDPTRRKPVTLKRGDFERQWGLGGRWLLLAAPVIAAHPAQIRR